MAVHCLGVFGGPAEVFRVSVFDDVFYEGEVDDFVYLAEKVVPGDNAVIEIAAVEGVLGWLWTEHINLLSSFIQLHFSFEVIIVPGGELKCTVLRTFSVDTHGHSPWHFTGQSSLDLNPAPPVILYTQ